MTEKTSRGLGRLITGIVLMVLVAPLLAGLGIWIGISGAQDAGARLRPVTPAESVHLRAGAEVTVLGSEHDVDPTVTLGPVIDCTVAGPGGAVRFVPQRDTTRSSASETRSARTTLGRFNAPQEGTYRVDCDPYQRVRLDDSAALAEAAIWGLSGTFGGLALGGLTFLIGLVLTILGVVRMASRRRGPAPSGWVTYQ